MTAAAFAPAASLAQEAPLKIGVVTFLSGPAASPFGVPARNAAESIGAALYVKEVNAGNIKSIASVNQNYAWGHDSWVDFEASMKQLTPGVQVATSQMPKLFAGQYNAEISTVLGAKADVVHSSFWDGDLEAFILQAGPRGLFKRSTVIHNTAETEKKNL